MSKSSFLSLGLPALILAAGFVLSGFFIKDGLTSFRTDDRVVKVKGLAEREVEADLAIWTLSTVSTGNVLSDVQAVSNTSRKAIAMYLDSVGFTQDEFGFAPLSVQDLLAQAYRPDNVEKGRYIATQRVTIRSTDIDKIDRGASGLDSLLKQGITLSNMQAPNYVFTKLNEIKPEMLAEAVQNARKSAQEFAQESGADVGGIKRASQGLFQILPRDPVSFASERNQRFKRVRVVSTVDFFIE